MSIHRKDSQIAHSLITLQDLYVGEESGDLKIDLIQVLLMPLLQSDEHRYLRTEDDAITNFGLILIEMLTNKSIVMNDIDHQILEELIEETSSN